MALKKRKKVKRAAKKAAKKAIKKASKKRPIKKKTAKRKPALKKKPGLKKRPKVKKSLKKQEGNLIGLITHYFPHVQAAVIKLKGPLTMGDTVKIKGHTTDLTQIITSMQIDRVDITNAKKGDEIGLQVSSRVRQNDKVYKV
jgi:hypothetical protein